MASGKDLGLLEESSSCFSNEGEPRFSPAAPTRPSIRSMNLRLLALHGCRRGLADDVPADSAGIPPCLEGQGGDVSRADGGLDAEVSDLGRVRGWKPPAGCAKRAAPLNAEREAE